MKNIKRYIPYRKPACGLCFAEMKEDLNGDYISYSEYLEQEIRHREEITKLKARIEELENRGNYDNTRINK